jgi:hypothetical protein
MSGNPSLPHIPRMRPSLACTRATRGFWSRSRREARSACRSPRRSASFRRWAGSDRCSWSARDTPRTGWLSSCRTPRPPLHPPLRPCPVHPAIGAARAVSIGQAADTLASRRVTHRGGAALCTAFIRGRNARHALVGHAHGFRRISGAVAALCASHAPAAGGFADAASGAAVCS